MSRIFIASMAHVPPLTPSQARVPGGARPAPKARAIARTDLGVSHTRHPRYLIPRQKYFARLFLQNTVPNSAGRMRRYLRCLVWETPRSVLAPRPFNWFQCVRAPKKSHFDRARASQTPRWPHTARRCTGTPQTAQNTTASHQKRALVGGWSINTALPPGGVARPRYDTEMAVSTWPSICT